MIEGQFAPLRMRVLVIDDKLNQDSAEGRAARVFVKDLESRNLDVVQAISAADGQAVVTTDAAIHAILLDWTLGGTDTHTQSRARKLLSFIRERNDRVPVFLMADSSVAATMPVDVMALVDELVWTTEDTASFVSGRVEAAARRYIDKIMPPMAMALARFAGVHEYSWHTPGHNGGTAFLKSPVGRVFHDYFGENLLRSDLSVSVGELGSLLGHSGPIGDSEKNAARVFGAHRTYCVTNGSSTANRTIFMAAVTRDQVALCDRNCHKSIEHGLTMTGAIPTYLVPVRNRWGLIGPVPPSQLQPDAVSAAIAANPLVQAPIDPQPVFAVVINSTYDGLCIHAKDVEQWLGASVDRLMFDEAWYAYARFHPLYAGRFAMRGDPKQHQGPTVFATHSTHKVLAALSQASFLHVRDGRNPIPHERFNESFMMHASTSPLYTLIASNDVAAAMMDGRGGTTLVAESVQEAVAFRQMMGRTHAALQQQGEWFFNTWNADVVTPPGKAEPMPFHEAPAAWLASDPQPWVMRQHDRWHGFDTLPDGYCMLDPIKVSVLTPGVGEDGSLLDAGIPARLVTAYLAEQGIQIEKTSDFTLLVLFSFGITKGKWGTLVHALLNFKRDHDANAPLDQVLPSLVNEHPSRYAGMGLRDLAEQMFGQLRDSQQTHWLAEAFETLPTPHCTPADAYRQLVLGRIERVPLGALAGRVLATSVVPYPPGIPLLMPGEYASPAGSAEGPCLRYLQALQAWDARFPGFTHDTHGVDCIEGIYHVQCLQH